MLTLAAVVAFLAFPNLLSTGGTSPSGEEHGTYETTLSQEPEEYVDTEQTEDSESIVQEQDELDFPEPISQLGEDSQTDWDEQSVEYEHGTTDISVSLETSSSRPYVSDSVEVIDDLFYESLSMEEIMEEISSFKSRGETYYNAGQERLDRTIVRYAAKIIHLCDNYETMVNN